MFGMNDPAQTLLQLERYVEEGRMEMSEVMATQFELLDRYESVDGGWGYYDFRYGTKKPSSSSISTRREGAMPPSA